MISSGPRYSPVHCRLSVRTNNPDGRSVADAVHGAELRLMQAVSFNHILFLIHGYNNSADYAEKNYTKFNDLLRMHLRRHRFDIDAIVHFHWPGNPAVNLKFFAPSIHYPYALLNSRRGAERLGLFISNLPRPGPQPSSLKISIVGHSMGCRLIMEMLRVITNDRSPSLECVSLMAAAVPVKLVATGGELAVPADIGKLILKCFSPSDRILRFMFPLGQRWSTLCNVDGQPIESDYYREAVGFDGNPGDFAVAYPRRRNGHGDYWGDEKVVKKTLKKIDPTYVVERDYWEVGVNTIDRNSIARHEVGR